MVPGEPAALVVGRHRALVVADLHIGFERELSRAGANIPSQTPKTLARVRSLVERYRPDRLILLGDVKHGVPAISDQEWAELPEFFERLLELGVSVEVVPGNHDGGIEALAPRGVVIHDSRGVEVEGVALLHGHTWPSRRLLRCRTMVVAHNHLVVELRDRMGHREVAPVWMAVEVDGEGARRIYERSHGPGEARPRLRRLVVMPAFNTLLPGKPVNAGDRSFLGPILESGVVELDGAEVFMVDGTYLGRLSELAPKLNMGLGGVLDGA